MVLKKYLIIFLASLTLIACAKDPEVVTETVVQTVTVKPNIPIQSRPDPVDLRDVNFYVVTEENFEEFKERFVSAGNEFVFIAISVSDYKDLALNIADLESYIKQQGSLIVYYENSVR